MPFWKPRLGKKELAFYNSVPKAVLWNIAVWAIGRGLIGVAEGWKELHSTGKVPHAPSKLAKDLLK